MRVSLIGGAGFIGHNLAITLINAEHDVQIIDHLGYNNVVHHRADPLRMSFLNERFDFLESMQIPLWTVDGRDATGLFQALSRFEPEVIVHLSAISSAVSAKATPGLAFDLQLTTLNNVLDYTQIHPINNVVFMSSSTVYGNFKGDSVDEETRPRPFGIYATAKFMGERLLRVYNDQYGLGTTIIRPSALYGERCVSSRVSQQFLEDALEGKPLKLEGKGEGRLDFTYIEDLTTGILLAIEAHVPETSETFNLTYGNARTIRDLAIEVQKVVPEVKMVETKTDRDKPVRGTLSNAKARQLLGFQPQFSLEQGYPRYADWFTTKWDNVE